MLDIGIAPNYKSSQTGLPFFNLMLYGYTNVSNINCPYLEEENTYYGAYQRAREKTPSLQCPNQERDYFTTSSSHIGNKALMYPIVLITADEMALAGLVYNSMNR